MSISSFKKVSQIGLDRESGLDWYDSRARWLDPAVGRTTTMDPKAESYYSISPYAWCANNPVRFVDPDGKIIKLSKGTTSEQIFIVLGNIQKITDDKVVFSTQKDGSIRIKIASLGKGNNSSGTRLIRRINSSNKTMTINVISNDKGHYETDCESR